MLWTPIFYSVPIFSYFSVFMKLCGFANEVRSKSQVRSKMLKLASKGYRQNKKDIVALFSA
jgi:hypothetical protein